MKFTNKIWIFDGIKDIDEFALKSGRMVINLYHDEEDNKFDRAVYDLGLIPVQVNMQDRMFNSRVYVDRVFKINTAILNGDKIIIIASKNDGLLFLGDMLEDVFGFSGVQVNRLFELIREN